MPIFYYKPGACSLGSHIVLEWIGLPYAAIEVDPSTEAFRFINPAGAVPALRLDDGVVITQSAAVLRYLATTYPEARLAEAVECELDRWTAFLTGDLHPSFFPLFRPDRYTISTDPAQLDNVKAAARGLVEKKLDLLDARLSASAWIAGPNRTYVDAYATPMLRWAVGALPGGIGGFPNAARLLDRMLADRGVIAAMRAEGLA